MAEQVKPAHSDPAGVYGLELKTARVMRRERARIPSWLGADPALHSEAAYIGADRFRYQTIPLAIRRRTIHIPQCNAGRLGGYFDYKCSLDRGVL